MADYPQRTNDDIKAAFEESKTYLPTPIQEFQFIDKYARFDWDKGRRETWQEAVTRASDFLRELSSNRLSTDDYNKIHDAILNQKVMPSMRLMQMAGPAARRSNITLYNCSFIGIDDLRAFDEILTVSTSGTGVGFSVERQFIEQLPEVSHWSNTDLGDMIVEDSAEGWAAALRTGIETWFAGKDIWFDFSQIRPAGAVLKTKGGRASGHECLMALLIFTRQTIMEAQGRKLNPIEVYDICCEIGTCAVSGAVRRSAMICLFDFDDNEMLNAKKGEFHPRRWNSNNSAVWPPNITENQIRRQFSIMHENMNGEPGIFSREAIIRTAPARRTDLKTQPFGINPCVVGDTWVAVADGRGRAKMSDLVAANEDVDVFTVKDGKLCIRTMRNPRKTGTNTPILKVSFTDGTFIRVTPNHKFILKSGEAVGATHLQPNDAIDSMTVSSYRKAGLPKVTSCHYDEPKSYRMLRYGQYFKSEHRKIYEHHTGIAVNGAGYHIHHLDFDGRNNGFENLQLLSAKEHAFIHRDRMLGKNNPVHNMTDEWRANISAAVAGPKNGNAIDITNEELEQKIVEFVKRLGYRPSTREYLEFAKANGLPQRFTSYRESYFGTLQSFLVKTAESLGFNTPFNAKAKGLGVFYKENRGWVYRICENCGSQFEVLFGSREQACCSHSCGQRMYYKKHGTDDLKRRLKAANAIKMDGKREKQLFVYNDLVFSLGRHPMKQEWVGECKRQGISFEISRTSSPFRKWNDLKEAASIHNHRVLSVEDDGYEDVYTGTVDDTHTYFAIGTETQNNKGYRQISYVLNEQCGEIELLNRETCNLSAIIARHDDNFNTLKEKVRLATIIGTIQSTATHFPDLRPEWKENAERERLLGVDITGQMDCPAVQDRFIMDELRKWAIQVNEEYAAKLGINKSVAITCVKPSGNTSVLVNCSSGIHARFAPFYVRRVRIGVNTPVFKVLQAHNAPLHPENGQTWATATTAVMEFPIKAPDGATTIGQRSALEQLDYWKINKLHWTEHNPSCTISYSPDELEAVVNWVVENKDIIGGLSFLPRDDAAYSLMPYEEITEDEYEERVRQFPAIDWSQITTFETSDETTSAKELACSGGACEIEYVATP